jgi:hypothetical protein
MSLNSEIAAKQGEIETLASEQDRKYLGEMLAVAEQSTATSELKVMVSDGAGHIAVPAADYYRTLGVTPHKISTLFDERKRLKYTFSPDLLINGTDDKTAEFTDWMYELVRPLYEAVQLYLDETGHDPEIGFNNHELDLHIHALLILASFLCSDGALSQKDKNLLMAAIMMHDIGNAFNRFAHPEIGDLMQLHIFGEDIGKIDEFTSYREAIHYHDEKISSRIITDLMSKIEADPTITPEDRSQAFMTAFGERFSIITSYLRMVDKAHFGRDRIKNTRPLTQKSFKDEHIMLNALFHLDIQRLDEHFNFEEKEDGKRRFSLTATFSLSPSESIPESYEVFHNKNRTGEVELFVPEAMKKAYKENGILYFSSGYARFVHLYYDRMMLMALDVFNMYPDVDEVNFNFIDPRRRFLNKKGEEVFVSPYTLVLNREQIFDQMQMMKRVGAKNAEDRLSPYKLAQALQPEVRASNA